MQITTTYFLYVHQTSCKLNEGIRLIFIWKSAITFEGFTINWILNILRWHLNTNLPKPNVMKVQFKNVVSKMAAIFYPDSNSSRSFHAVCQGVVSLTFRELPKIFSRKYTTPEITFMVRISIWKFVRVPKARLWALLQSFSLKFSSQVPFVQYTNFERSFWRARETLVKQPPGFPGIVLLTFRQGWTTHYTWPGGRFKNIYELLNARALKISMLYKNRIFQCMGKIFCVEFQRVPLKFHTKYLIHTLKDVHFIHRWKFKSS